MKNLIAALLLCLAGCGFPLKPGTASLVRPDGTQLHVKQSENPKNETKQVFRRTEERSLDGNTPVQKTEEVVETTIGAAQKDTAREIGAKLHALSGVVWVGVILLLFGVGSAVYPPLKLLVGGSLTTSAVIAATGLGLIILPSLLVGHELLILCVGAAIAGAWYFAHRHGTLKGELTALKGK